MLRALNDVPPTPPQWVAPLDYGGCTRVPISLSTAAPCLYNLHRERRRRNLFNEPKLLTYGSAVVIRVLLLLLLLLLLEDFEWPSIHRSRERASAIHLFNSLVEMFSFFFFFFLTR
jgi:hypothetical protein